MKKRVTGIKKILSLIFIIVLISALGFLVYFNFFVGSQKPTELPGGEESLIISIINTDFKSDFLNKLPYTELKSNIKLPIAEGKTGRSNPFRAIPFSLLSN